MSQSAIALTAHARAAPKCLHRAGIDDRVGWVLIGRTAEIRPRATWRDAEQTEFFGSRSRCSTDSRNLKAARAEQFDDIAVADEV